MIQGMLLPTIWRGLFLSFISLCPLLCQNALGLEEHHQDEEHEIGQLLKYALDTLISFFSFIVKEYGVQICIKFF